MGLLSGIFGGQTRNVDATGFYAQPKAYQNLYKGILKQTAANLLPNGQVNTAAFTPLAQTQDETNAFNSLRQGFTPTAESLAADMAMLQNPFDQYVVNDINREAQGQNSIYNQAANEAGQFGSNRTMLNANTVEQGRLDSIGRFRQGQYNTNINTILNGLNPQRQQDAQNLLGIGGFQRGLDWQTQQAPIAALQAAQGGLAGIPQIQGNQAYTVKSGGGLGGLLSGIGSIGSTLSGAGPLAGLAGMGGLSSGLGSFGGALSALALSDRNLKENIKHVGEENGHKIYEFSYKGDAKRHIGVMADEVEKTHPEAVKEVDGYKTVNYDMIGVKFREAE